MLVGAEGKPAKTLILENNQRWFMGTHWADQQCSVQQLYREHPQTSDPPKRRTKQKLHVTIKHHINNQFVTAFTMSTSFHPLQQTHALLTFLKSECKDMCLHFSLSSTRTQSTCLQSEVEQSTAAGRLLDGYSWTGFPLSKAVLLGNTWNSPYRRSPSHTRTHRLTPTATHTQTHHALRHAATPMTTKLVHKHQHGLQPVLLFPFAF